MKFRFIKEEKGAAIILLALALVILIGFAAVTIDIGMVSIQKGKIQNALDAASLAAAQALPAVTQSEKAAAIAVARDYVSKNGFSPDDIALDVSFSEAGYRVNVSTNKTIPYTFAQVLGMTEATVENTASAKKEIVSGGSGGALDYVLFSGSKISTLTFTGRDHNIKGNIHSNYKINFRDNPMTITGRSEAVAGFENTYAGNVHLSNPQPNASVIEMPVYSDLPIPQSAPTGATFKTQAQWGINTWNNNEVIISEPVYVTGDFYFGSGKNLKITGNGCIVATGKITINNGSVKVVMDTNNPIGIRSMTSSVDISSVSISGAGCVVANSYIKIPQLFDGSYNYISTSNPIALMSQNGYIIIATPNVSGPGGVYAKNNITFETGDAKINVTGPLAICSTDGNLYMKNTAEITGIAYAPKGTISFTGDTCTVKGSLIADNMNLTNTILGETGTGGGGSTITKIMLVE